MNQSYINKGLGIDNILNVDALNVNNTSKLSGNTLAKNMVSVNGNTTVNNELNLQNNALFSEGFSSSTTLNLNNNKIVNVSDPGLGTDLINLRVFNQNQPQYYSYQSVSGDYYWAEGTAYPWLTLDSSYTSSSPFYSNYIGLPQTNAPDIITLTGNSLYTVSVYVYKAGGLGNGYGGHLRLNYLDYFSGDLITLGWMYMWNQGGQNFPGALVDITFPAISSNGGALSIHLIDQNYFKVEFMSFQIIRYPL